MRSTTPSPVTGKRLDALSAETAAGRVPKDARLPTRTTGRAAPCARQFRMQPASARSMLASVAPLVNVTFFASAPTRWATCSRASLDQTTDGPALGMHRRRISGQRPGAAVMATRASSRRGAVAFQSK